jgi:hypothetical protein
MILLLVAGNVPGTLQFAARFPLRSVANKHGNPGAAPPKNSGGATFPSVEAAVSAAVALALTHSHSRAGRDDLSSKMWTALLVVCLGLEEAVFKLQWT